VSAMVAVSRVRGLRPWNHASNVLERILE